MGSKRVLVVHKRTSIERHLAGRGSQRAAELLARGDEVVAKWTLAHEAHRAALRTVEESLRAHGVEPTLTPLGSALPDTRAFDLIVTVGGDGTLLGTSHAVGSEVPVLGVNSAPGLSVGFFCAADARSAADVLGDALAQRLPGLALHRMQIVRNGQDTLTTRVLNEVLFCHISPAATSRYLLSAPRGPAHRREPLVEDQRSSGLWVGPAAGSTAAQRSAGGRVLPLDSQSLQFVVREPYVPLGQRLALRRGLIGPHERLEIRSKMRRAKAFVDGEESVLPIELGDQLELSLSPEPLHVLGLDRERSGRPPHRGTS